MNTNLFTLNFHVGSDEIEAGKILVIKKSKPQRTILKINGVPIPRKGIEKKNESSEPGNPRVLVAMEEFLRKEDFME